jgi:putative hemin transport protein
MKADPMTDTTHPTPAEIRAFRAENPKMRERDIAARLGISEAALVAAEVGLTAVRIDGSANRFLERAEALGENIDLRIFPGTWAHGFAVTKTDGEQVRRSLQFFDKAGTAVHKVHLRPASNLEAYEAIVADFRLEDQSQDFVAVVSEKTVETGPVDVAALRESWSAMTDTHQFFGMLRKLKIARQDAVRSVGEDFAHEVRADAVGELLRLAAERGTDIMCFAGNHGAIQIHTGPVVNLQPMGPWLNVLDPTFHMHLRTDHIAECWVVRKPTSGGHVTSLEAYDASGEMIVQFFGKRKEGMGEREDWRGLLADLPRPDSAAA